MIEFDGITDVSKEAFDRWVLKNALRDPVLARVIAVKKQRGATELEFCRMLIYAYKGALALTQSAFTEHLEKCGGVEFEIKI